MSEVTDAPAAEPADGSSGGGGRAPAFPLILAITITGIMANTLVTPAIPDILDGLGQPRSLAGILVASATFPGIVMAAVLGVLADRIGRREVLVPSLLLFGGAGVSVLLVDDFWVFIALRFLQGIGSAALINLGVVLIGDHWRGTDRVRLIGRNAAVLTACLAVFPVISGALTDLLGWRAPFALYGVAVPVALASYVGLPAGERHPSTLLAQLRDAAPVFRRPEVNGSIAAFFVSFVLIFGLMLTVLPVYIDEEFGLGASWRGVLLGIPALGSVASSSNMERLTTRFGRRPLMTVAVLLAVASFLVIGVAPTVIVLAIGAVLFGLFDGTVIPSLQDVVAGAATSESRGAAIATQVSFARLGQTIGPILATALAAGIGAPLTFAVGAGVALLVLTPLVRRAASAPSGGVS